MPDEIQFEIERARQDDATGIARCFSEIYGDHYFHPEVFSPTEYWKKVTSGEIVPVVTRNEQHEVIGHLALELLPGSRIAERGEALVLPRYRGHHLLEAMTEKLFVIARELGLTGIFAQPLTMHTFSQQNDEHAAMYACSLMLGACPEGLVPKNMPVPTYGQRQSFVTTFRFLDNPEPRAVFIPDPYRHAVMRIYEKLGVSVTHANNETLTTRASTISSAADGFGITSLNFGQIGSDFLQKLHAEFGASLNSSTSTIQLSARLDDPGLPALTEAARKLGFFFCGIGPTFVSGADTLILQFLREPLDMDRLQLFSDHTKFLASFVAQDRRSLS